MSRSPLDGLRDMWQQLARRERIGVALAGLALGVLLLWLVALGPALDILRKAPQQRSELETQLQSMRQLAAEAASLRATPPLPPEQAGEALKQATAALGEKARLTQQGDRVTVNLTGVAPTALRDWLLAARSAARARPVQATLTQVGQTWSGTIVLALGGGA